MSTCQYFIKKTKNPRICSKKSNHTKSSFLTQNLSSTLDFDLHLCSKHFGMIAAQIIKKITHSAFFNFRYDASLCRPQFGHNTNEWKFTQLVSILTQRIDEFNRVTRASHSDKDDEVTFIEEKSENQVLGRKFEEAKRDGRYIDLTESTEQKTVADFQHCDNSPEMREHQIECPVCLDNFSSQNITFLECAHPICNECISNIVKRNITQQCPVCRHAL